MSTQRVTLGAMGENARTEPGSAWHVVRIQGDRLSSPWLCPLGEEREIPVHILALPFTSCVAWDKSLPLSGPQNHHLLPEKALFGL